ncbi:MAG: hypothetical protein ACI3W6_06875 [Clostridia bacterium]
MKKISVFIAALVCCVAFAACGMNGTATKNFTTIAEDFTMKMYQGDYDGAAAYVSEDNADMLNAEALEEIVTGTESAYGDFQEITGLEQTDMDTYISMMGMVDYDLPDTGDYVVYYESLSFEKGEMGIYFFFDYSDRTISGITVCGTEELQREEEVAEEASEMEP